VLCYWHQPRWQAASAWALAAAGIGEALMTAAHTSLPAARAPATSPLAALLQIPSTFAFKLAESVGSLWMTDLHTATACATPAAVVGTLVGTLGVFVGEDVAGEDVDVAVVVDVVAVVAGWVTLTTCAGVELDVELLLLPQPARSTPPTSATTNQVVLCLIMCPLDMCSPLIE
jgi:hypothetical protein